MEKLLLLVILVVAAAASEGRHTARYQLLGSHQPLPTTVEHSSGTESVIVDDYAVIRGSRHDGENVLFDFAGASHSDSRISYTAFSAAQGRDHFSIVNLSETFVTFQPSNRSSGLFTSTEGTFLELEGVASVEVLSSRLHSFRMDLSGLCGTQDTVYVTALDHEAIPGGVLHFRSDKGSFPRFSIDCDSIEELFISGGDFDGTLVLTDAPLGFHALTTVEAPSAHLIMSSSDDSENMKEAGHSFVRVPISCSAAVSVASTTVGPLGCTGTDFIDVTTTSGILQVIDSLETEFGYISLVTTNGPLIVQGDITTNMGDLTLDGTTSTGSGVIIDAEIQTGGNNILIEGYTTDRSASYVGTEVHGRITATGSGIFELEGEGPFTGLVITSIITAVDYDIDWEGTAVMSADVVKGVHLNGADLSFSGGSSLLIKGTIDDAGNSLPQSIGLLITGSYISSTNNLTMSGICNGSLGTGVRVESSTDFSTQGSMTIRGETANGVAIEHADETVIIAHGVVAFSGEPIPSAKGVAALLTQADYNVDAGSTLILTGDASGTDVRNGVQFSGSATLEDAAVVITGRAGMDPSPTVGVELTSTALLTGNGSPSNSFTITGTGGGAITNGHVGVVLAGTVDGPFTVLGTGGGTGSSSSSCYGVDIGLVTFGDTTHITGTGGSGVASDNYGIHSAADVSAVPASVFSLTLDGESTIGSRQVFLDPSSNFDFSVATVDINVTTKSSFGDGISISGILSTLGTVIVDGESQNGLGISLSGGSLSASSLTVDATTGLEVRNYTFTSASGPAPMSFSGMADGVGVTVSGSVSFGDDVDVMITGTASGTTSSAIGIDYAAMTPPRSTGSFVLVGDVTGSAVASTGVRFSGGSSFGDGDFKIAGSVVSGTGVDVEGPISLGASAPLSLFNVTGVGSDAGVVFQQNVDTNNRNVYIDGSATGGTGCTGVQLSDSTFHFNGGGSRFFVGTGTSCSISGVGVDMSGVLFTSDSAMTVRGVITGPGGGSYEPVSFGLSSSVGLRGGSTFMQELVIRGENSAGLGMFIDCPVSVTGFVKFQGISTVNTGLHVGSSNGITVSTNGQATLEGEAGATSSPGTNFEGIHVLQDSSSMAVSGIGGSLVGSVGLVLSRSTTVTSASSAALSLGGTGGMTGDGSKGVHFEGTFNRIDVGVTGSGGGSGTSADCHGVFIGVVGFSNGALDVDGTGGPGTGTNHGIIMSSSSVITGIGSSISIEGIAGGAGNSVNAQMVIMTADDITVTTGSGQSFGGGVILDANLVTANDVTLEGVSTTGVGLGLTGNFDVSSRMTVTGRSQAVGGSSIGARVSIAFLSSTGRLDVIGQGDSIGVDVHSSLTLGAGSSAAFDGTVLSSSSLLLAQGLSWNVGDLIADGVSSLTLTGTVSSPDGGSIGVNLVTGLALEDAGEVVVTGDCQSDGVGILVGDDISLSISNLPFMDNFELDGSGTTGVQLDKGLTLPEFTTAIIRGASNVGSLCVPVNLTNAVMDFEGSGSFVIMANGDCTVNKGVLMSKTTISAMEEVLILATVTNGNAVYVGADPVPTRITVGTGLDVVATTNGLEAILFDTDSTTAFTGVVSFDGTVDDGQGIGVSFQNAVVTVNDFASFRGTAGTGTSAGLKVAGTTFNVVDTTLTLDGVAGAGGGGARGVLMEDSSNLFIGTGLVDIIGHGGPNSGVGVELAACLQGVDLVVDGTGVGSMSQPNRYGVDIKTIITDAAVTITGQGGQGSGVSNPGIHAGQFSGLISNGTSDVTLTATGGTPGQGPALYFDETNWNLPNAELTIENQTDEDGDGLWFDNSSMSASKLIIHGHGSNLYGVRFSEAILTAGNDGLDISGTGGATGLQFDVGLTAISGSGSLYGNGTHFGIDSLGSTVSMSSNSTSPILLNGLVDSGAVEGAKAVALGQLNLLGSSAVFVHGDVTTGAAHDIGVLLNSVAVGEGAFSVAGTASSDTGTGAFLGGPITTFSLAGLHLNIYGSNACTGCSARGRGLGAGDIQLNGFGTGIITGVCSSDTCDGIALDGSVAISSGDFSFTGVSTGTNGVGIRISAGVTSPGSGDLTFESPGAINSILVEGAWTHPFKADGLIKFDDHLTVQDTVVFQTGAYDVEFNGLLVTGSLQVDNVDMLHMKEGEYEVRSSASAVFNPLAITPEFTAFTSHGATDFQQGFDFGGSSLSVSGDSGGSVSFARIRALSASVTLGGDVDYTTDSVTARVVTVNGNSFSFGGGNIAILQQFTLSVPFTCIHSVPTTVTLSGAQFVFSGTEEAFAPCDLDFQGSNLVAFNPSTYRHSGATIVQDSQKKRDVLANGPSSTVISGTWENSAITVLDGYTAFVTSGADLQQGLTLGDFACLQMGTFVGDAATVTMGSLLLTGLGTVQFDVHDITDFDKIIITGGGTVDLGSMTTVNFVDDGSLLTAGDVFSLIEGQSSTVGQFANATQGQGITLSGETYKLSYSFGDSGADVALAGTLSGSPDAYSITGSRTVPAPGVLANDTAYMSNPSVSAIMIGEPSFGNLSLQSDGGFFFDGMGQPGVTIFTYALQFDVQTSDPIPVTLTVFNVSTPTATPSALTTPTPSLSNTPSTSPSTAVAASNSPSTSHTRTPSRSEFVVFSPSSAPVTLSPAATPSSSAPLGALSRSPTPTLAALTTKELAPLPASASPIPSSVRSPSSSPSTSRMCPVEGCDAFLEGTPIQPEAIALDDGSPNYLDTEEVYRVLIFDELSNIVGRVDIPADQSGTAFVYGATEEVEFIREISSVVVDISISDQNGNSVTAFEDALQVCFTCTDCVRPSDYCLGFFDISANEWRCQDRNLSDNTDDLINGEDSLEGILASEGRLRLYCGRSNHLTNFALLLDAQGGGGGDDDDDGGYLYAYLSAAFIGAAIIIVIVAAVVIEAIIRLDTSRTNSRLSMSNKQHSSMSSIGSSSEFSAAPEIPAFQEPTWEEEEEA